MSESQKGQPVKRFVLDFVRRDRIEVDTPVYLKPLCALRTRTKLANTFIVCIFRGTVIFFSTIFYNLPHPPDIILNTNKTMLRLIISILSLASASDAFTITTSPAIRYSTTCIHSKESGDDVVQNQQAFAAGSFVEFVEKKRTHIGKIDSVEHKSSGGARYK